jgi:hypothetical protein
MQWYPKLLIDSSIRPFLLVLLEILRVLLTPAHFNYKQNGEYLMEIGKS